MYLSFQRYRYTKPITRITQAITIPSETPTVNAVYDEQRLSRCDIVSVNWFNTNRLPLSYLHM